MIELVDEQKTEPYTFRTTLKSVHPDPNLYPTHPLDFLIYSVNRRTQRIRKERDKGLLDNSSRRRIWKQFENYKISCRRPHVGTTPYWDKYWGNPPFAQYFADPHIGSVWAGYWYWTTLSGGPFEPFGEAGKCNLPTTVSGKQYCPPFYVPSDNGSFIAPPALKNDLCLRALKQMLPQIKEELSSINSVYELKDFAIVRNAIRNPLKTARHYAKLIQKYNSWERLFFVSPKAYKKLQDKTMKMTLREWVNSGSGSFLQWKFAIAPLISDITALQAALTNYKNRISDLVNRTGGIQTRHFTYRWDEFEETTETKQTGFLQPWIGFNGCVLYEVERLVIPEQSVFHAQIQYNYNYTKYQQQHAATLALLDSLGLNFNPAIIWNALPWSFVVDWVLRVGDLLDRFAIQNLEPQINIHQFLWSIKRERSIWLYGRPSGQFMTELEGALDRSTRNFPRIKESAYGRFLDYPVDPALVQASGLSSSEFTLGAALITSNVTRRRR